MTDSPGPEHRTGPYDAVVTELQRLRVEAGSPSYAALAIEVTRLREARGVPASEARPGRTTVYDVFRTGRRRLDEDLVLDLVRALGGSEEDLARWAAACRAAREPAAPAPTPATAPGPTPDPTPDGPGRLASRRVLALLVGCLALNLVGRVLVDRLELPLYLDMVGTAIAAVVVGPWWGALVGLATNVGGVTISGWTSAPFALVNVTGALLWGYGVRRWGLSSSSGRFFLLSIVVAVACTVVAVPILLALGDSVDHDTSSVVDLLVAAGDSLVVAVLSANLLTSIADKLICGFAALAAAEALGVDVGAASAGKPGRRHRRRVRGWSDPTGRTLAEER